MRTTLDIPQDLLFEAMETLQVKTKTQAIITALRELVQRKKSRKILKLEGSLTKDYNYKENRRKR